MRSSPFGLEVVDEDVAPLRQTHEELASFISAGIDGHRQLVPGKGVVHSVAVPRTIRGPGCGRPVEGAEESGIGQDRPRVVSLGRGWQHERVLDPDHLGSEVGEEHGGVGSRPHGGEIDDPDPLEWRARCLGPQRRRSHRRRPRLVSGLRWHHRVAIPEPRCEPAESPTSLRESAPGPRQVDRSGRRIIGVNPEVPLVQVVRVENLPCGVHARKWPSRSLRRFRGLGSGARQQPRVHRDVEGLLGLAPLKSVGMLEGSGGGRIIEHLQHLPQLLWGGHHRHVPVGAREDSGRDQSRSGGG